MVDRNTRSDSVRAAAAASPVRLSRPALLLGTALGCSLVVFAMGAPGQAFAANDCGSVTSAGGVDTATCTAGVYPNGIHYSSGQNLSIVVDPGVTVSTTAGGTVIGAYAPAGFYARIYTAPGDTVSSTVSRGLNAEAPGGEAYIVNNADVTVFGKAIQVYAAASGGNVSVINTGDLTITQAGASYADGIVLGRTGGQAYLNNSGAISASAPVAGAFASGIYIGADSGANIYNSGAISLTGDSATGITNNGFFRGSAGATTVHNNADIYAHATGAATQANGIALLVTSGDLTVVNNGNITAIGDYAYGVYMNAKTALSSITETGNITATGTGSGYAVGVQQVGAQTYTRVEGDTTATSAYGKAAGLEITATGAGASYANVRVYGNVSVDASSSAIGISVTGPGASTIMFGNLSATAVGYAAGVHSTTGAYRNTAYVSGDVTVTGGGGVGIGAVGANLTGSGYVGAKIGGNLTVYSDQGPARGVEIVGADGAISVGGDVDVSSGREDAIGLETDNQGYVRLSVGGNLKVSGYDQAFGAYVDANGGASLSIGGDVTVSSASAKAYGAHVYTTGGGATVSIDGNVSVSADRSAMGVYVQHAATGADVTIGGSVLVNAYINNATGVGALTNSGDAIVTVGGGVGAYSSHGNAQGVLAVTGAGAADVIVGGPVVVSGQDAAVGVGAYGTSAYVHVLGGGVSASSPYVGEAIGVQASARGGDADILIGGTVSANAEEQALGLEALAAAGYAGNARITVYGDVVTTSSLGYARGARADAYGVSGDASIHVTGNVSALGFASSYGLYAKAAGGNASIVVGGDVITGGEFGEERGLQAVASGVATIEVGGNVSVTGGFQDVYGIDASGQTGATAIVNGDVYVSTTNGFTAVGVNASSQYGNATAQVGGNLSAHSGFTATGLQAYGYSATATALGDVNVSANDFAGGVDATSFGGNATVGVAGNVTVTSAYGSANGVFGDSRGGSGNVEITVTGGITVAGPTTQGQYKYANIGPLVVLPNVKSYASVIAVAGYSGTGNVTVTVGGPISATGLVAIGALGVSEGGGSVSIDVGDVNVHQYGATASYTGAGIRTYSTGATTISAGNITAAGNYTSAIRAGYAYGGRHYGGDVAVSVLSASTSGEYSPAIYVAGAGNASVAVNTVATTGNHSDGVYAYSRYGGVSVSAGNVTTTGASSAGIDAVAGGPVVVHSTYASTSGDNSPAVKGVNLAMTPTDTVAIYSGTAITHGKSSDAIYASGTYSVYVNSGTAITHGYHSDGIDAYSNKGAITVLSGLVHTYYIAGIGGANLAGIGAVTRSGAIDITSDEVLLGSNGAAGIAARSLSGDIHVTSTLVHAYEDAGTGINVQDVTGNVVIDSNSVVTDGEFGRGMTVATASGNVTVNSQYVRTNGDDATAIYVISGGGAVTVNSNTIHTYGTFGTGIHVLGGSGAVNVYSSYVSTAGDFATGIIATSSTTPVVVTAGTVKTAGDDAAGIGVYSTTGNTTVNASFVSTTGTGSVGIGAGSALGSAKVSSNYVHTTGDYSAGVSVIAHQDATSNSNVVITGGMRAYGIDAQAFNGNVSVTSNYTHTTGAEATGIFAQSQGAVTVNATNTSTTGELADAVVAQSYAGNASVTTGYVRTSGYAAQGVHVEAFNAVYADNTGYVETTGANSDGVFAESSHGPSTIVSHTVITSGDHSRGINVYGLASTAGAITVTSSAVVTHGYQADAIFAQGSDGGVSVTSGTVLTYGKYSTGIVAGDAGGPVSVDSTMAVTHGYGADAIYARATTLGDVSVVSGTAVTYGAYSPAVTGMANEGNVTISATGPTVTHGFDSDGIFGATFGYGNVTVNNSGVVHADDGVGVHLSSAGYGTVTNSGAVYGGRGGVVSYSALGTTINNQVGGSISGAGGYAIGVYGGAATINNAGTINGYALLTANDDTVNNTGTWNAYGQTEFGAGTDTFNNAGGTVRVAPFSAAATTVTWTGLEAFNNSGLVDLRNGHTGDIFQLNADVGGTAFTGTGNSQLGVDVAFGPTLSSDKLVIGAAGGQTTILPADVTPGAAPTLDLTGTTVVQGTSGTASNFVMPTFHKGFVDFELSFNSANVTWNIVGLPSNAAFEFVKVPAMAEGFWRRTGDAWSAREQEIRDSMWGSNPGTRGEGWELWSQAQIGGERLGGVQDFTVLGQTFTPNLRTDTDWRGFQAGADTLHGNWLWGLTGGFLEQNTIFHADRNSLDMTGWNFGGYGGFTSGHFFLNGLVKGDWFEVKSNMPTVPAYETFNGNDWGAKAETGFRIGGAGLYFEPVADISWTSTHLDNAGFQNVSTTFSFGDSSTTRGSIGARAGAQWGSILPYIGIYAVDEWDSNAKVTMVTGSGCPSCISIDDVRPGSYGKADLGFTTTSWNGLEGFVKVEDEFGSHVDGFIGRLGVRWRW